MAPCSSPQPIRHIHITILHYSSDLIQKPKEKVTHPCSWQNMAPIIEGYFQLKSFAPNYYHVVSVTKPISQTGLADHHQNKGMWVLLVMGMGGEILFSTTYVSPQLLRKCCAEVILTWAQHHFLQMTLSHFVGPRRNENKSRQWHYRWSLGPPWLIHTFQLVGSHHTLALFLIPDSSCSRNRNYYRLSWVY